jgi:hypothetical protein
VGSGAEHRRAALAALDDAAQEPGDPGVPVPALALLAALAVDGPDPVEERRVDERLVLAVVDLVVPAELAGVGGVAEDEQDRALVPLLAAALAVAGLVELSVMLLSVTSCGSSQISAQLRGSTECTRPSSPAGQEPDLTAPSSGPV